MLLYHLYAVRTYSVYADADLEQLGAFDTVGHAVLPAAPAALKTDPETYFVKTHELPRDDSPAIYLVRDGRDAVVSFARYQLAFQQQAPGRSRVQASPLDGSEFELKLDRIIRSGGWSRHVLAWTERGAHAKTVVVQYDELVRRPNKCVQDALQRLNVPLRETGQHPPAFADLQAKWPQFFRRGKTGVWRDEMPKPLHRLFWLCHGDAMQRLGYDEDAPPPIVPDPVAKDWQGPLPWGNREEDESESSSHAHAVDSPSVSMSSLGRHGAWGNTVFQYVFLKTFARQHGLHTEVPGWLGQYLYENNDAPLTRRHAVVLRDNVSLVFDDANPDGEPNRTDNSTECGRIGLQLKRPLLSEGRRELGFEHADLEGLFLIHTRHLAPHRDYIASLFRPVPPFDARLRQLRMRLRALGKTAIGIHLRRGDLDATLNGRTPRPVASMHWYLDWLEQAWERVKDPVVLLCGTTESLSQLGSHFARFEPVTVNDLGPEIVKEFETPLELPEMHLLKNAGFYPDWFLLGCCDLVAISNSTFGFTACMFNTRGREYVRPDPVAGRLVRFNPWDAEPLLSPSRRRSWPATDESANTQ